MINECVYKLCRKSVYYCGRSVINLICHKLQIYNPEKTALLGKNACSYDDLRT